MDPVSKKNANDINHMYPKYRMELVTFVISSFVKKYMNEYTYKYRPAAPEVRNERHHHV